MIIPGEFAGDDWLEPGDKRIRGQVEIGGDATETGFGEDVKKMARTKT
jgi:hypothetical protein